MQNNPAPADAENITKLVRDFIVACNAAQVRLALQTCMYFCRSNGTIFVLKLFFFFRTVGELCHLFTSYLVKRNDTIQGVKIMAQAVEKIRGSDTQLTAVHADLCQLSLCAKVFNSAVACLDLDITSIASTEVREYILSEFLIFFIF